MTHRLVTVDARHRVTLPGAEAGQQYVVVELPGGSLHLEPAHVVTQAQLEYLESPELQQLLTEAAHSPTVRRSRRHTHE